MRRALRLTLAASVACLALATPAAQAADAGAKPDAAAVQALYDRAMEAYQAGRFEEAARGFEAAYAQMADVALLWNIGRAWEQAGELEKARETYTAFLSHDDANSELRVKVADALVRVGSKIQARKDAKTADERIAQLQRELAEAKADNNAELVRKLGRQLESEGGSGGEGTPTGPDGPGETGPKDPFAPMDVGATADGEASGPSPWSWVTLGLGVVAAGTGTWLMLDAEDKRSVVKDGISGAPGGFVVALSRADAQRLEADANRNGAIGVGVTAVGGALVVTGVILALVTGGDDEPAVSLGTVPRPGGAVLSAAGRF